MNAKYSLRRALQFAPYALTFAIMPWLTHAETVISCEYVDLLGNIVSIHGVSDDGTVAVGDTYEAYLTRDGDYLPIQNYSFVWKDDELEYLSGVVVPRWIGEKTLDVSADGSTVIGTKINSLNHKEAFCLQNGVFTDLGILSGATFSEAHAVSADGSVVVGESGKKGFKYQNGTMESLGDLLGGFLIDDLHISADGSIIAGSGYGPGGVEEAFRWEDGVATGLGILPDEWRSHALHISADGTSIFYWSDSADGGPTLRWRDGVIDNVSFIGGWPFRDGVYGVSGDGSVAVGIFWVSAFLWENGVLETLPSPTDKSAESVQVSLDGSVVSGSLTPLSYASPSTAVYWSKENDWDIVYLDDLLDDAGIDRQGYQLTKAVISGDGTTLIASAINGESGRLYRIRFETSDPQPQPAMWGPYAVLTDGSSSTGYGWVYTGEACGCLYLMGEPDPETSAAWTYSLELNQFIYFCEAPESEKTGSWVYILH